MRVGVGAHRKPSLSMYSTACSGLAGPDDLDLDEAAALLVGHRDGPAVGLADDAGRGVVGAREHSLMTPRHARCALMAAPPCALM